MAIVDLDSHLRDGWLLDEIYQLPPFTRYSPRKIGDGKYFYSKFEHDLLPRRSMRILAKMGEFVNRRGIHPPLADADKIQAVEADDFDAKGFAEKTQEYQKLFLR